ncbi:hypothetical protein C2G38_2096179, partial [Gigaspora rosea]
MKDKWVNPLNQHDNRHIDMLKNLANSTILLKNRGKIYFVIGRFEKALEDLTTLLNDEKNNTFALRYRAETYLILKKYDKSYNDLMNLLTIDQSHAWALEARGVIYYR